MFKAFVALYGKNPEKLILGTFPSIISREKNEYYANPKNQFWCIIFNIFNEAFNSPDYEKKKDVLIRNKLALWDTVKSCNIEGSKDENIKNAVYNKDILDFIKYHNIKTILFNGRTAYNFYSRYIEKENMSNADYFILPSSSPANARIKFEQKVLIWKEKLL